MEPNIGLNLESRKDNDDDSKKNEEIDWGLCFSILKNRGFNHQEILNLSYPQFNAYMLNINNPYSYNIVIPYMGSNEEEVSDDNVIESKEELMSIIADMNSQFNI